MIEYFDIFDEPIRMEWLSLRDDSGESESWASTLPISVWYSLGSAYKDTISQEKTITIKAPIELRTKKTIAALVEFKVEPSSDETKCRYVINRIVGAEEDAELIAELNRLEPDSFWAESDSHKKIYDKFISKSKVNVFQGEGQRIRAGKLLLGTKIGPKLHELTALIHEMGHLVEIDDERVLRRGWGFSYGESTIVFGAVHHEPSSYSATLRECRVMAIQRIMQKSVGIESSIRELLSPLVYMHDWCLVPGRTANSTLPEVDEARFRFLTEYLENFAKTLSLESIMEEWERKQSIL
jgi:hypothetical protein